MGKIGINQSLLLRLLVFVSLLPASAMGQSAGERFEGGVFLSGTFLRRIGSSDSGIGTSALGIGGRLAYEIVPHLDLESELVVWPNNDATSGMWVQGLFGAKAGMRFSRVGLFAKARPGFIHFSRDPFGASHSVSIGPISSPPRGSTEPSIDLGGVFEYKTSRGLILRFDLGDTMIHYGPRLVSGSQSQPAVEAGGFTTHNWEGSFGFSWRF